MAQLPQTQIQVCGNIEDVSRKNKAYPIIKCQNEMVDNIQSRYGYPYIGIERTARTMALQVASAYDKKKIDKEEFLTRLQQITAAKTLDVQADQQRQQALAAQQQAAENQRRAAILQQIGADLQQRQDYQQNLQLQVDMAQRQNDAIAQSQRFQTTCTRFGNAMNCY